MLFPKRRRHGLRRRPPLLPSRLLRRVMPHPASPIPKRHGFSGRPDPAGSRWAEKRPETAGDDAYGAGRAVLERLQEPATRAEARRLLGAVPRRFADDSAAGQEECFRASNLRIRDVVLNAHLQGGTQMGHQEHVCGWLPWDCTTCCSTRTLHCNLKNVMLEEGFDLASVDLKSSDSMRLFLVLYKLQLCYMELSTLSPDILNSC